MAKVLKRMRLARHADITELRRGKSRVVQRQLTQEEIIMFEEQFGASIWRDDGAPTDYYIPADKIDHKPPDGPDCRIPKACLPLHCTACREEFATHNRMLLHYKAEHIQIPDMFKEGLSLERVDEERRMYIISHRQYQYDHHTSWSLHHIPYSHTMSSSLSSLSSLYIMIIHSTYNISYHIVDSIIHSIIVITVSYDHTVFSFDSFPLVQPSDHRSCYIISSLCQETCFSSRT